MAIFSSFLPVLDLILVIGFMIGGIFAMRAGFFQQSGTAQALAIDAQDKRIEVLEAELHSCNARVDKLQGALDALATLLKPYNLRFEVNGAVVRLIEDGTRRLSAVEIHVKGDEQEDRGQK